LHDRLIRRDGIEIASMREARAGPVVLVPACAADPCAGRGRRDAFGDAADGLGNARHAFEVDGPHREAGAEEMCVAVGESGQDEPAAGVDHLGA